MKKGQIEMLTARQFSERAGVSYPTVMKWLKAGLVPGAKLNENTPLGTYWEIPATSVGKIEKEKPGPKPKASAGKGDADDEVSFVTNAAADVAPATDNAAAKPAKKQAGKKSGSKTRRG